MVKHLVVQGSMVVLIFASMVGILYGGLAFGTFWMDHPNMSLVQVFLDRGYYLNLLCVSVMFFIIARAVLTSED